MNAMISINLLYLPHVDEYDLLLTVHKSSTKGKTIGQLGNFVLIWLSRIRDIFGKRSGSGTEVRQEDIIIQRTEGPLIDAFYIRK